MTANAADRLDPSGEPRYLALLKSGELAKRSRKAQGRLRDCEMCPQRCGVDRSSGELGVCRTAALARVASYGPHFGEENPLVGRGGSGTIFFAGCNLACLFCQNHDLSQPAGDPAPAAARPGPQAEAIGTVARTATSASGGAGREPPTDDDARRATRLRTLRWEMPTSVLAEAMLELQAEGCENINFVSPSHVVPQILSALVVAATAGLRLPLVYNSGGYDSLATLRLLEGVVDIYMPDMKYADDRVGAAFSGVPDYVVRNRAAVFEMHRQVGDLHLNERGVATRGLLVRHLVLPAGLAGTAEVARFLATQVSRDTYINVMDQYRPAHKASRHPELSRRLTTDEYLEAVERVRAAGLWRLDEKV
jgi:putative pyruvate formate lyase activating enzyme